MCTIFHATDEQSDPRLRQVKESVRSNLVHQLYTHGPVGLIGALFGAIIVTIALWHLVPSLYLMTWLSVYVGVHVLRYRQVQRYLKAGTQEQTPWTWEWHFAMGTFAGGALWGLAAVVLFPENSVVHQYMLALFVAGISCGAAAFYWPSSVASLPTIWVELLPLSGRFLYKGDETGTLTGIVILVFCVVVSLMARHLRSFGMDSLILRIEKDSLLQSLQEAGTRLEQKVNDRTRELSEVNEALRHEIDERARVEQSFQKSEEKYRLVVDHAQEAIMVAQHGMLRFVNPQTMAMLAYSEDELLSQPFTAFIHPDDRDMVHRNHVRRLQGEDFPSRYGFRVLHKTGSVKWVEISSVLIQWEGWPAALIFMTDITDRREAEDALRQSEERYRTFFDTSRDAVFMTSVDGRFTDFNDSTLEMFGYPRTERSALIHTSLTSLYARPEDREAHVQLVMEEGFAKEYPAQLRKRDGTVLDTLITTVARKDPTGRITGFQGTVRDVTDRKRAEDMLRESEAQYRALFDSISDALFVYLVRENGSPGRFIQVNDEAVQRLGYTKEELLTMTPADIVYPNDYRSGERTLSGLIADGKALFEGVHVTKDGRHIIVENSVKIFRCRGDLAVLSISRDITDRKTAEVALRESERRFRSLLQDVASVPVQGYDEDRKVLFWNSASERLYGYSREEAMGRQLEDLIIPPPMRTEVVNAVNNWIHKGQHIPAAELGLMRKDKSIVPVYSSHVMLEDSRGKKEMYCVDVDLTELKKAEEERTMLRSQLAEAQKMEAIGTLASGIAHDFNNLLQVTLGFSELILENKTEDDPDYDALQKIQSAALSGAELVQNLLTFSRKVEPRLVPLSLNHQVKQVEKLLVRTIPRMIDIRLELAEDLQPIDADPARLEQMLINLALNGRDAMPEGGMLTMSTRNVTFDGDYRRVHPEARKGPYVHLSVSDSGHGMDAEVLKHIFEPFFTTKELGRGTGLGLAMVYGIVNQHGGHIVCQSEVGRGTRFDLYFPAILPADTPTVQAPNGGLAYGTETILLVDDEELVRELGERFLRKGGYSVLTAGNGREALDAYTKTKEHVDLVILDLIMPSMGGKDCLRELLSIDPSARVLIASGLSSESINDECRDMGAKGLVVKPFRFKELLTRVRNVIDETP